MASKAYSSSPPHAARLLVVDDAADTRLMISLRLQREGYTVLTAGSGPEALEIVNREGLPDLVVLDVMMPGMDGFVVAEELRQMGDIPIIFLSALSDTNTKVEGLTRYAEDYVTKPFAFSELLARIRRVLLRVAPERALEPELVIDEHLRINFAQQYAIVDDEQVTLTPTENRIMHILYHNRGRVLSPGFLLAKVWDPTRRGTVESLWVHVRRLRSKIEPDPDNPRYVLTVRGQGYCLPQRNHMDREPTLVQDV
ncbi:MAG: response regulator transcription factor [Caldilineaceae bacterium]|nr:response regulator transcription factor [Caldilineaceae bacterium]